MGKVAHMPKLTLHASAEHIDSHSYSIHNAWDKNDVDPCGLFFFRFSSPDFAFTFISTRIEKHILIHMECVLDGKLFMLLNNDCFV